MFSCFRLPEAHMSWHHSHCIYSQSIFTITPDIINFKLFKNSEPDIVLLTTCTCRQTYSYIHPFPFKLCHRGYRNLTNLLLYIHPFPFKLCHRGYINLTNLLLYIHPFPFKLCHRGYRNLTNLLLYIHPFPFKLCHRGYRNLTNLLLL